MKGRLPDHAVKLDVNTMSSIKNTVAADIKHQKHQAFITHPCKKVKYADITAPVATSTLRSNADSSSTNKAEMMATAM